MKFEDILGKPQEREHAEITDISVLIPSSAIAHLEIALESQWTPAEKGWMYRVDAANPAIPLLRHVHIAKKQHTASKDMQVSWNVDGTRHDKKSFNKKIGQQNYVRNLAKEALKLDWSISLESNGTIAQSGSIIGDKPTFSEDGSEAYIQFSLRQPWPKTFDW
ncbi:DUF6367 family protein [Pseudomonas sp. B21-015]|uniref:DUF6367 family protein n=1 Tax=Pseudomonas sp. B21-015 TaxID=2895473 RepID=UPI00215F2AA7|nr:DUF6367 family protein [Pseudomonas sp. B21-015]UVM53160.1 DUF6367 family protein [Pseudomonas sp. B21-015]